MSSAKQRQLIGFFKKLNGIDEDTYREMLSAYSAASCKDLSSAVAEMFLARLKKNALESGVYKPKKEFAFNKNRRHSMDGRLGMASAAQLRKIEAMWFGVSRQQNDQDRKDALNKYIKRITGKDNIRFLTGQDVQKIVKALENTRK